MTTLTPREQLVLSVLASQPGRELTTGQIARGLADRDVRATPDSIHRTAVSLQRKGLVMMYGAARIVRTYRIMTAGAELARKRRLEELRAVLRAENISLGELVELQALAPHIDPGDTELLEAAGVPEFPEQED